MKLFQQVNLFRIFWAIFHYFVFCKTKSIRIGTLIEELIIIIGIHGIKF